MIYSLAKDLQIEKVLHRSATFRRMHFKVTVFNDFFRLNTVCTMCLHISSRITRVTRRCLIRMKLTHRKLHIKSSIRNKSNTGRGRMIVHRHRRQRMR